jgi:hypothetical protein
VPGGYRDWSLAGWREHLPGVDDAQGLRSFTAGLGGDTIPALAAASAAGWPGRVAVTVDGEPVTHAELEDAAARIAGWLSRRAISPCSPTPRVPRADPRACR